MVKRRRKPEITREEVSAICQLIDHAKKQGVRIFEGPAGIRFTFAAAPDARQTAAKVLSIAEGGDPYIP